jgi:hypothetical protein
VSRAFVADLARSERRQGLTAGGLASAARQRGSAGSRSAAGFRARSSSEGQLTAGEVAVDQSAVLRGGPDEQESLRRRGKLLVSNARPARCWGMRGNLGRAQMARITQRNGRRTSPSAPDRTRDVNGSGLSSWSPGWPLTTTGSAPWSLLVGLTLSPTSERTWRSAVTLNPRIKSPLLSYRISALAVGLCRSVRTSSRFPAA